MTDFCELFSMSRLFEKLIEKTYSVAVLRLYIVIKIRPL